MDDKATQIHLRTKECATALRRMSTHIEFLLNDERSHAPAHAVQEIAGALESLVATVRAVSHWWGIASASAKQLFPDPGQHRRVLSIAAKLVSSITQIRPGDYNVIYNFSGADWNAVAARYRDSVAAAHLSLPKDGAIDDEMVNIRRVLFDRQYAACQTNKKSAREAAQRALDDPANGEGKIEAGDAKRKFYRSVDEAMCLAREPEHQARIRDLITLDYAPLNEIDD